LRFRNDARRSTTAGAALAAMALVAGLSGCVSGEPEAAPSVAVSEVSASPSPSPVDPAEAAKEERIAAAQEWYEGYVEISTTYYKKGEDPFWELADNGYIGQEIKTTLQAYGKEFTEKKFKQVGDTVVASYSNAKYEGDPLNDDVTGHRVTMDACIDNTGMDVVKPDGSSTLNQDFPKKVIVTIVMQGQPAGNWALVKNESHGGSC
jgi:hypothetical protein